jgi:hypothetical protein
MYQGKREGHDGEVIWQEETSMKEPPGWAALRL